MINPCEHSTFLLGAPGSKNLSELLRVIDVRRPRTTTFDDLIEELAWPTSDVVAGLRDARVGGLIECIAWNNEALELSEVTLTAAAISYLGRQSRQREPHPRFRRTPLIDTPTPAT